MARIGVSITKSTPFRGSTQEFSNVYYYNMASLPSNVEADAIIDNLTALEKSFHSTAVTFLRGRCWSETGNKLTSQMISQKNLSGTGATATVSGLDPERAYLFRIAAGIDSRGNPVYLRKWYHPVGVFKATVIANNTHFTQQAAFTSTERNALVTTMTAITNANNSAGSPEICSKSGRQKDPLALWDAHKWLEHHQFGDQWRNQ